MNSVFEHYDRFVNRHIGPTEAEAAKMLEVIGVGSLDELIEKTIPNSIRLEKPLQLSAPVSEFDFLRSLRGVAAKNRAFKSYIGMGYYDTITPTVILRNILENPGWYTQYTPYQAEISQGRLESLLNYQTMVMDLTGMEIANASLLDEATAAAEAMHLMHALDKGNATKLFVAESVFPQTLDVLYTRTEPLDLEVVVGNPLTAELDNTFFGAILQYPDASGSIEDYRAFCESCHAKNILVAVACDLLSLTLLTPPGEFGADVAFGSAQRFGVPMGYGGPHAAFFATKDAYKRQMPGRIIGVSIDAQGNPALRMALQTREQHIKRDKATSNICTAQALLANIAAMYAVYHGPNGLKAIAERVHACTKVLAKGLETLGCTVNASFFDTISVTLPAEIPVASLQTEALNNEINLHYGSGQNIQISCDETTSLADIQTLFNVFIKAKTSNGVSLDAATVAQSIGTVIPEFAQRTSAYLTHPVFNKYHNETDMLRYLKRLENKDLSLAHSMIALGSCTMKLNATTEMIPVTWGEFGGLHPFAPLSQTEGYAQIFK
ncbi:MAG: glycine dehydrogenase (aminomethyl-transferring), partial [Candidatus Kapabacteria bacterium]|nr:glycine dehydrogenase (aminomethyl-transferring) [Candidatus Kapabacteria bacterium]